MISGASNAFDGLLNKREVVICVGSGGVGKTTTSAVIGLHAALAGRKVLVLTIDPARRLANSLGIDELGHAMQQIPLERFTEIGLEPRGQLWAMMLDMKESFDRLVDMYAPDRKTRDEILTNRFYQYFSTSLAGTQEYAASERLFELYTSGDFDLIVLDTPPTTHALDFLEAPSRLIDAVSTRALQWLYKPGILSGKPGLGIVSVGTSYVMRTLSRFTGGELLNDLSVFLRTFSSLFEGFEARARRVQDLLASDVTSFVVVTAPDTLTVEEALFFYDRLGNSKLNVDGFVVNRVHPKWVPQETLDQGQDSLAAHLKTLAQGSSDPAPALDQLTELLVENAAQFQLRATQDALSIEKMRDTLPSEIPILRVPFFNQDIHSLQGLDRARRSLFEA
jgi:anion-transporting  ArsA/GET3 family ATPase